MPDAIRVGIVGARFAARFHFKGYQRVYGVPVAVVGATSRSPESREAFAGLSADTPGDGRNRHFQISPREDAVPWDCKLSYHRAMVEHAAFN